MQLATRPPLARMMAIDRAVRQGNWPNATTLARDLEVAPRTIRRDITYLRDQLKAPLEFDPARNGYCYSDAGYRLPFLNITEGELLAICLAGQALRQYRGTPFEGELDRAFAKVLMGLEDKIDVDLDVLSRVISFRTTAPADLDPELFGRLTSAIRRCSRLEISYWTEVDPLGCVDGNFYLIAYCHRREEILMFSHQRIRSVVEVAETFEIPDDFRPDEYLADAFGVLRSPGPAKAVVLRFSGQSVKYVRERKWHTSQSEESGPDGSLIVRLEVAHLREVERWALSRGADCQVLAPDELVREVRRQIVELSNRYSVC